jgi:hypothetical protein
LAGASQQAEFSHCWKLPASSLIMVLDQSALAQWDKSLGLAGHGGRSSQACDDARACAPNRAEPNKLVHDMTTVIMVTAKHASGGSFVLAALLTVVLLVIGAPGICYTSLAIPLVLLGIYAYFAHTRSQKYQPLPDASRPEESSA